MTALLALVVGLYRIGAVSPWADEAVTVIVMQRSWPQLFQLYGGSDAPLIPYYVLAKLWVSALPWLSVLVALRVLSAVAAALAVACTTSLVSRRAGTAAALLSAFFLISLPGLSRYAQEARPYSLLLLATTATWLAWDTWSRPALFRSAASAAEPDRRPGVLRMIRDSLAYVVSLAGSALIHLFGLFQWPAQLLADLTAPNQSVPSRIRRALTTAAAMALTLIVVGLPVAIGALRGTGPAKSDPLTASSALDTLDRALVWREGPTRAAIIFAAALLAIVLWCARSKAVRRYSDLIRISVIWAFVPLFFAIATAFVKPALLRPRYWLPVLPPLSVLAALALLAVARRVFELLERAAVSRGMVARRALVLSTVAALCVILVPVTAHTVAVLAVHADIRSQKGHGMSMTPALTRLDAMLAEDPDLPVLVSPGTRTPLMMTMRPELTERNALFLQDPNGTTVWPTKQSAAAVAKAMTGHDRAIWLHSQPGTPKPTAPPKVMQEAGFRLASIERVGSWWFSILVRES